MIEAWNHIVSFAAARAGVTRGRGALRDSSPSGSTAAKETWNHDTDMDIRHRDEGGGVWGKLEGGALVVR